MTMSVNEFVFFASFLLFIGLMLAIDLGLFNKKNDKLSLKEALVRTLVWVGISIGFYFFIRSHGNLIHGSDTLEAIGDRIQTYSHPISIEGLGMEEAIRVYNLNLALEYLTGYLIEYSLSVDNVFVIIMIFLSFNIRQEYYKKVLFWGILGAIVMRFLFIFAVSALIQQFAWFLLIFGGILLVVGGKMGMEFFTRKDEDRIDTEHHPVVRFASKWFSVTREDHGEKFWIKKNGKRFLTPLFIILLIIEFTDVIFAVDSVPAVFSVTQDPYIVFFSNIFAILGLRSLFFLVMNVMNRFHYLKLGLAVLLTFVGVKMILHHFHWLHLSTQQSLMIIAGILLVSVIASLIQNALKQNGRETP
ncbi:MAG: TerC/Alx family metal homeostasis membrane protein [bacterium]